MTDQRISISLSFVGELRSLVGVAKCELILPSNSTGRQLIAELEQQYPALSEELSGGAGIDRGRLVVFVNGLNIAHTGGLDTSLRQGDLLVLAKPLGGG